VWKWRQAAERLADLVRAELRVRWQRWLRLRERLRLSEGTFHLAVAVLVGMVAGGTNLLFYAAVELFRRVVLGQTGDWVEVAEELAPWARVVVPAVGGLVAGAVLHWSRRWVGPHRPSNFLEVVAVGDGRLPFRATLFRGLSSLISIGTGASIGREGMVTQLSAMLASKGGERMDWPPYRLRLLVACGAAAGLAAAYNAPIGGAVFAAQIVLGTFAMNLFAPLICASVVAAVVSRSFFGIEAWYRVPDFEFTRITQLPWFVVLGAGAGVLGAAFLRALEFGERTFARLRQPVFVRLALAGVLVGVLAIWVPEVWGNGYSVTSRVLGDEAGYTTVFLAGLLLAKLAATVVTVGAGTVGGVFTPTLFLGAALGSAFGHGLHAGGFAAGIPTGVFALAGMAGTLAATTHSPLLAMIVVFEISLKYSLMPALMVACVVATLLGRRLHPASVYTEPLRQKGLLGEAESDQPGTATERSVGDLMRAPVPPVRETATLPEVAQRFLTNPNNFLPVVDLGDRLVGVVALQDLKAHLNAGDELKAVIAMDVMRPVPPCLTAGQKLNAALPILLASELRHVPVVSNLTERRLIGSVPRNEALGLLEEAIAARSAAKE
jgi:CIC family chloride channel protein